MSSIEIYEGKKAIVSGFKSNNFPSEKEFAYKDFAVRNGVVVVSYSVNNGGPKGGYVVGKINDVYLKNFSEPDGDPWSIEFELEPFTCTEEKDKAIAYGSWFAGIDFRGALFYDVVK